MSDIGQNLEEPRGMAGEEPGTRSQEPDKNQGPDPRDRNGDVVVVGGGLAGIGAAVRLAEGGRRVVLVESRRRLGGRAASHVDPVMGRAIDNCQHVLLGCCTNLIDLYRRLRVWHLVDWHDTVRFVYPGGETDALRAGAMPAPLHLAEALAGMGGMTWREKAGVARAIARAMGASEKQRRDWHGEGFGSWLRRQGQSQRVIARFWETVGVSALNETIDRVSAAYGLQVFLQGFLGHREGYRVGVPRVPLSELYERVREIIEGRGGQVLMGDGAKRVDWESGRVGGIELASGRIVRGEAYVSALPADGLSRIAPEAMRDADARLKRLDGFEYSPIVGVHVWVDRVVLPWPHAALVASPAQWVFDGGRDGRGQVIRVAASAAREWAALPPEEIVERVMAEVRKYLPAARGAKVIEARVVKERKATFSPLPGVEAIRPAAVGAIANLYLAGDWCATGWPATMEGAVRSGYRAAEAILGEACLVADLARGRMWRMASISGAR